MTLEHAERERNYCSVAHELKVPFTAVDANGSKCSRARESRLVRLSKECKHEQHGRRVVATSGKSHATLTLRSKSAAAKPRRSSGTDTRRGSGAHPTQSAPWVTLEGGPETRVR